MTNTITKNISADRFHPLSSAVSCGKTSYQRGRYAIDNGMQVSGTMHFTNGKAKKFIIT